MFDFSTEIVFSSVVALMGLQSYYTYFRTNNTDGVDLLELYSRRQMAKRYRGKGYEER